MFKLASLVKIVIKDDQMLYLCFQNTKSQIGLYISIIIFTVYQSENLGIIYIIRKL